MSQQTLADELHALLAAETRSLVRHLGEATPYLTASTYPIWSKLEHMAQTSDEHAKRLTALIDRLDLPPRSVIFASGVANYHYSDLPSLLPRLIREKRQQLTSYQRVIASPEADHAVVRELSMLTQACQSQLEQLITLTDKLEGSSA